MKRVVATLAVAVCLFAAGCGGASTATPTHVAAVFFDGVTNGDFRQTCSVWQSGRHHMQQCESYLAFLVASQGHAVYRVVPHSYKGWREGRYEVATVKVRGPYGIIITARLVKEHGVGWVVVAAS